MRFLLCRSCAVLHPLDSTDDGGDAENRDADARELRIFEAEHAGHVLEEALRTSPSSTLDHPAWDPMATLWFFVRSGSDEILVRAGRESIEDPRSYCVEPEPPHAEEVVEIDAALVRRALDRHFFPHAIPARKLDRFVDLLRDLVGGINAAAVEISFDDPSFADAGIAPVPDPLCRILLEHSASIFDPWELERLAEFIAAHRREDGALALRVHRGLAALSA
jgi:hypothetical protein